jgi:hypothetical protein
LAKPAYFPTYPSAAGTRVCPRCQKGELVGATEGSYVAKQYGRFMASVKRTVFYCNNSECDYENIVRVVEM